MIDLLGHSRRRLALVLVIGVLTVVAAACGNSDSSASTSGSAVTVRLGYFPNLTHATGIVGVERGIFAKDLAPDRLSASTFNAGPAAVEALFSGALDAAYIGPNPAINAFARSRGQAIRIIAGATSGGAALVVKPDIADAGGLKGKKLASPQLGNTQDVALRSWLAGRGLKTDAQGGGDVSIVPQENAQTLETFKSGAIDGAWVPEPWVTRLVTEGGGKVLVNEKDLWPNQQFVTTHLVVRTAFLRQHPQTVARLLEGHVEAGAFVNDHAADAQQTVNQGIEKVTGKAVEPEVIQAAWENLTFTNDPVASSLLTSAKSAEAVGLLDHVDLKGIYDLAPLNSILKAKGELQVQGA